MFNKYTVDIIKNLPSVEGVDIERLPQLLSLIYAHIIGLQTKYGDDTLDFVAEEIDSDLYLLKDLSFTLEIYLESNKFEEYKRSLAFVAALAHKLIGKIEKNEDDNDGLSMQSIPEKIISILLFTIGGYFADAEEIANQYQYHEIANEIDKTLVSFVCRMAKGELLSIVEATIPRPTQGSMDELAEDLLYSQICHVIRNTARYLLGNKEKNADSFEIRLKEIQRLTVYELDNTNFVYAGPNRLCRLLMMALKVLTAQSMVNIVYPHLNSPYEFEIAERINNRRPYLWDNHIDALQKGFLEPGVSSVITYPTGAGKSTLVELKIMKVVAAGQKVIYLVPTHSLEKQVNSNLFWLLGLEEKNGLSIGKEFTEVDSDEDSPVLVMTPERCSTLVALNPATFDDVGLVVIDEFHIISIMGNSSYRAIGAMYCLLSLLAHKPEADYILVSAMVENGKEISEWISETTGRMCLNLSMTWKPTSQLQGCIVYLGEDLKELRERCNVYKNNNAENKKSLSQFKKTLLIEPYCFFSLNNTWETKNVADYYLEPILDHQIQLEINKERWYFTANKNEVAKQLAMKFASIGLKTIIVAENPVHSNSIVKNCGEHSHYFKIPAAIRRLYKSIITELGSKDTTFIDFDMAAMPHHAWMLSEERYIAEQLFKANINILVATATLAQGVNLPADVVVIAGDERYDEEEDSPSMLDANEILNAAGRAGRAGFRSQGAAILIPSKVVSIVKQEGDGYTIGDKWFNIKDNIFSKGDQCLKVADPFSKLADKNEGKELTSPEKLVLMKLNLQEDKSDILKKTLYSYQLRSKGSDIIPAIQHILDLSTALGNINNKNAELVEVAFKSGVDIKVIESFYDYLDNYELNDNSVIDVLDYYFSWLTGHPIYLENLLVYDKTLNYLRKVLPTNDGEISKDTITVLKEMVIKYVQGEPLSVINPMMHFKRKDSYLVHARKFVLGVIPELSYSLGILSMTTIVYMRTHGIDEIDISDNITNLATYMKEGVLNGLMLDYKVENKMMRVDVHKAFGK